MVPNGRRLAATTASRPGAAARALRLEWPRHDSARMCGFMRPGVTTDTAARVKELEREVRELRQANEILKKASAYFAQAELDRPWRK